MSTLDRQLLLDQPSLLTGEPSRLRYGQAIRRHAWLVGLVVLLGLGLAFVISAVQDSVYQARTSLVVARPGDTQLRPEVADIALTQTVAGLAETDVIADTLIQTLKLNTTTEKFQKKLKVTARPSASVIDVTYESTSKQTATDVLTTFNKVFVDKVKKDLVAQRGARVEELLQITVVSTPRLQPKPIAPRPARTLLFALLLSLIVGILLALLRERFNDRIRDRADATFSFGAPVIGALPRGWQGPPMALTGRRSASRPGGTGLGGLRKPNLRWTDANDRRQQLDEALSLLSLNVEALRTGRRGVAIVVTSTRQEEGKSTVVANLAVSLAKGGMSVLCVEVDGREPSLHTFLNVEPSPVGLAQIAKGGAKLHEAKVLVPVPGLTDIGIDTQGRLEIVTLGDPNLNLASLVGEEEIDLLIEMLRSEADFVIFDASPLSLGEAHRLIRAADVALLVARRGWTRRARAQAARAILERLGVRRSAVVLTDADAHEILV